MRPSVARLRTVAASGLLLALHLGSGAARAQGSATANGIVLIVTALRHADKSAALAQLLNGTF